MSCKYTKEPSLAPLLEQEIEHKRCADCGRLLGAERQDKTFCRICQWKHGKIWVLDEETWKWRLYNKDSGEFLGIEETVVYDEETATVEPLRLWQN